MAPTRPDVGIAVLAKAPRPGVAKTRLAPVLGADGAAELQARLIRRTLATAIAAAVGPVTLWCAPDESHPAFQTARTEHGVTLAAQPNGDLGERMLAAGADRPTLVIGTDCPALEPVHLRDAAAALRDGIDAVAIPTEDGGYALIGTRRPQPAMFSDMPWSTPTVMALTRLRLMRRGLSWREPSRLWDVDVPADLARLRENGLSDLIP